MNSPRKLATFASIVFVLICSMIAYIRFTAYGQPDRDAVQIKLVPISGTHDKN